MPSLPVITPKFLDVLSVYVIINSPLELISIFSTPIPSLPSVPDDVPDPLITPKFLVVPSDNVITNSPFVLVVISVMLIPSWPLTTPKLSVVPFV